MTTIIAATNRPESYTLKLAEYYQRKLSEKEYSADLLSLAQVPDQVLHTHMYDKQHEAFKSIQDTVTGTDKFLFIVPEYNGSFPGVLKVFIDACKYPESFYGKKAALVGLSSGKYGNIRGIDHFTGICHYINLHVMPLRLHIPAIKQEFDSSWDLVKADTLKFTNQQIEQFIAF
ncbi:MAG TPA: NADPH-dependent FMN reductase [Sphingobacteriaceae bacterium]|nr:NADPH-dependent FMN reductase [Sphingobacteriaceae bacterium]